MEKLKFGLLGHALAVLAFSVFLSSCVNPEYDLENVEMDGATLLENISLPIGSVEKLTLEKVLFSNEEMPDVIRKDAEGNMYIDLYADTYETSFNVTSAFWLDEMDFNDMYVDLNMGSLAGLNTSGLPAQTISFSSFNGGKPFTISQPVEIEQDLPSNILDIRSIELGGTMNCHFSIGGLPVQHIAPITLKKGFEIAFPDCIFISKGNSSVDFSVIGGHVIRLNSDTRLDPDVLLSLSIVFDRITVPEGAVVTKNGKRYVSVKESLEMTGDFSFNTADISQIPEMLRLMFWVNFENMPVKSAEVSLDADMTIPDQEMDLTDVPDLFLGDKVCADLYNPLMSVKVTNSTPLPFSMSTDLVAYNGTGSAVTMNLTAADGINIPAGKTSEYLISRRETQVTSGIINIVKPVIGDMIRSVPEQLVLRNCNISVPDDLVKVSVGKNYTASVEYSVSSPLAFGEDLSLSFTQVVEDLGLSLDYDVKSVTFEMDIVNSIPVDFNLDVTGLDKNGNELSGTKVSLNGEIKGGSHLAPVTSPLKLEIKNSNGKMELESLRLTMSATAPDAEYVGVQLNEKQGFEIKNMVMTLPDGIGVKFN